MKSGTVYLVGAGPGDPGLITSKGLELVKQADVIVYDRLAESDIMSNARSDAELIDVGKIVGEFGRTQKDINNTLILKANEGKSVVRLKGGDPFVFGRGGEECEDLFAASVPFEVVPGITSAISALTYAGIPITHRSHSSYFTVVTGNEDPTKPDTAIDWSVLAKLSGTLVILMGWQNLPEIVTSLVENGKPVTTPVALVRWGTRPIQQTVSGTLQTIVNIANESDLGPPVAIVVGDVVGLRDSLRWFDNKPLFGKRVLVTRTRAQASTMVKSLRDRGAKPIELPSIEIEALEDYSNLDRALKDLGAYDWVVFTSVNAVDSVFKRLDELGLDSRAFGSSEVCAIGPATSRGLRDHGIKADMVPESFVSESIIESFRSIGIEGKRVLLPRADIARNALNDGLAGLGATVDEVPVYHTRMPIGSADVVKSIFSDGVDVATFTSSSTVTNLIDMLNGDINLLSDVTIACIGPITAETARDRGLHVDIIAESYTVPGLIEALESHHSQKD